MNKHKRMDIIAERLVTQVKNDFGFASEETNLDNVYFDKTKTYSLQFIHLRTFQVRGNCCLCHS